MTEDPPLPVIVNWTKDWSATPILDPATCPHPGTAALAIGAALVRDRPNGPGRIVTRAIFCMLCGVDGSRQMTADDAWEAAWAEHGWHASTGRRLLDLIGHVDPHSAVDAAGAQAGGV